MVAGISPGLNRLAEMAEKVLEVICFKRRWVPQWNYQMPETALAAMLAELQSELAGYGIKLCTVVEELVAEIKGYGDLLNSFRLRCPALGISSLCLGHVIGTSKNLDIVEDLRRGINRVAFAPETVEPEGSDKVICHNCGCGC